MRLWILAALLLGSFSTFAAVDSHQFSFRGARADVQFDLNSEVTTLNIAMKLVGKLAFVEFSLITKLDVIGEQIVNVIAIAMDKLIADLFKEESVEMFPFTEMSRTLATEQSEFRTKFWTI